MGGKNPAVNVWFVTENENLKNIDFYKNTKTYLFLSKKKKTRCALAAGSSPLLSSAYWSFSLRGPGCYGCCLWCCYDKCEGQSW